MKIRCAGSAVAGPLLQCRSLQFGYSAPLVQPFDLDVGRSDRVALLGVNGSGKSTLLRTLAQELSPLQGEAFVSPHLSLAYFSQHVTEMLPLEKTPFEALLERFPGATPAQVRAQLGDFGLRAQTLVQLEKLSGGERTRCALACVTFKRPQMLLLDEPTNHLDLKAVATLSIALNSFEGGIVLVSHDRRLIESLNMDCYMLHRQRIQRCTLGAFLETLTSESAISGPFAVPDDNAHPECHVFLPEKIDAALAKLRFRRSSTFNSVLRQLSSCGIATREHLELLIQAVVERAIADEHHDTMCYADFCLTLREWCAKQALGEDPTKSFRRLLLTDCQNAFEGYLSPSEQTRPVPEEKRRRAMLRSIQFLGGMIVKGVVGVPVINAVARELVVPPVTTDALESLMAFFEVVGKKFDQPERNHRQTFCEIFEELGRLAGDTQEVSAGARHILAELLQLRSSGWNRL